MAQLAFSTAPGFLALALPMALAISSGCGGDTRSKSADDANGGAAGDSVEHVVDAAAGTADPRGHADNTTGGAGESTGSTMADNTTASAGDEVVPKPDCRVDLESSASRDGITNIGSIVCSREVAFSVTEHRDASWVLLAPPTYESSYSPLLPRLQAFADGSVTGYEVPSDLKGRLWRSSSELPAVVEISRDGGSITMLSFDPEGHVETSTFQSSLGVIPQITDSGVLWAIDNSDVSADAGPSVTIYSAASLADPPTTVTYPGLSLARETIPHAKRPVVLARDDTQWFAADAVGITPTGIDPNVDGVDWLLDGSRPVTVVQERSDLPSPAPSPARLVAVLGAEPEFIAQRLVALGAQSLEQANNVVKRASLEAINVTAPVIVLNGERWQERTRGISECVRDCRQSRGPLGLQKALLRLGRDSLGDPWLVAAITTADIVNTTGKRVYLGERWIDDEWVSFTNVSIEIRLIRLALPYLERRVTILSQTEGDHDIVLDMVGPRGTLALPGYYGVGLWRIDLDLAR